VNLVKTHFGPDIYNIIYYIIYNIIILAHIKLGILVDGLNLILSAPQPVYLNCLTNSGDRPADDPYFFVENIVGVIDFTLEYFHQVR